MADDAPKQRDGRATEFSYPAIIESRPGVLAVTFTFNRRQIAFREFVLPSATRAPAAPSEAGLPSPVVPLKDGEEPLHLWLDETPDWNKYPDQYPMVEGAVRGTVFRATAATGAYSHHAQIFFWNGKFHAAWTNHRYGEDGPGQRVLHAVSPDGLEWGDPEEVFPPLVPEAPVGGTGFYSQTREFVEWEGRLFAQARFYNTVEWDNMEKTKKSPVFTRECRFPVCRSLGMLHREIRADGSLGAVFSGQSDLLPSNALVSVKTMKDYLPAFRWPIRPYRVEDACRQNRGFHRFTEQVVWKNKDGWALLFRDDSETYRKWASFSRDGRKWTAPRPTDILDAPSFSCVLTLTDGTVLLFGNHHGRGYRDPQCGFHTRDPLMVSVSRDGLHFGGTRTVRAGQQIFRVPGVRFRTGGAQYPTAISHGGFCYVIYSVGKEDIEVTRFPIAPLVNSFKAINQDKESKK